MKIEVHPPVVGEKIKVTVSDTAGFEFITQDHDREQQRFVLAFFKLNPNAQDKTLDLIYDITQRDSGIEHTLSAAVIVDMKVVATDTDRKKIRTAQRQG